MLRPRSLAISLAALLYIFAVSAGAKPEARNDAESIRVVFNNHGRSPCALALDMRSSCEAGRQGTDSPVTPTKCTCNNLYFNLWSSCLLLEGDGVLPAYDEWGAACKNALSVVTDGYAEQLDLDIPTWALIGVPGNNKFRRHNILTARDDKTANCTPHWSISQIMAPVISCAVTLIIVGVIFLLHRSQSTKKKRWPTDIRRLVMPHIPRVHKVRKADRSDTWSIDQISEGTDEFVVIEQGDADSFRVKSPEPFSHSDDESSPLPPPKAEWHLPGKALWKKPMQLPSRFPIPWKDRAIAVQSGPPTRRFHIDSIDHSTLSGLSGGSTEGGHRSSTVKYSMENFPGGSSRAHETIEEASDEGEDASLISPGARSENHVFVISNRDGFTVGSRTSSAPSHQVYVQPPTPTISSHDSPVLLKKLISKQKPPSHIPPPPTQPAPSPPVSPPRIPPQLQQSRSENYSHPIPTTSQLMDAYVPPIQPPISIPPPRAPGPLRIDPHTQPRRQLSVEEDDPLRRNAPPTRKPFGARKNLTSPSSKESLQHENAFSNLQYSTQFHQRQLSDSAARRSPLHWRDEIYPSGASPPYVYRELSIEEELSRPTTHLPGIAGPSSQLPRSPAPIPHRRGHSADDATSIHLNVSHPSPYSHIRNLSSESVILSRSDPVNLFPSAVRATGYPVLQAATESSNSLYSDGSYPKQPPNVAYPYPHHRS